jgi:hypothetical protein
MWNAGLDASTQFRADQADLVAVSARREALAAHESVQNAQIQRVLQSDATQFVLLQASLAAGGGFAALAAVSPMAALALNSVGTAHGVNSIADGYYSGSKLQFGLGVVEAGLSLFGLGAVTKALGRTETLTAAAWNPEWVNGPQLTRPVAEPEVVPSKANVGGVVVDAETLAARQATANAYYKTLGWDDDRIASHMGGIDFSQPVEVVTLPGGSKVVQYQIPGSPVGGYFAPVGTPAEAIGISSVGRKPIIYVTTEDASVLRSTAADTSGNLSLPELARGTGGGTQYFTNNRNVFEPFGG